MGVRLTAKRPYLCLLFAHNHVAELTARTLRSKLLLHVTLTLNKLLCIKALVHTVNAYISVIPNKCPRKDNWVAEDVCWD